MTIVGVRQTGKTLDLIKLAHDNGGVIVTYDLNMAKALVLTAKEKLELDIRTPITFRQIASATACSRLINRGVLKEGDKLYIDDIFESVNSVCRDRGFELSAITVGVDSEGIVLKERFEKSIENDKRAGLPKKEYTLFGSIDDVI